MADLPYPRHVVDGEAGQVEVTHRTYSILGAAWLALVLIHTLLQIAAPQSILGDPLLPFWARVSLLGTEAVAIAVLVLLAAAPFRLRIPAPVARGLRPALSAEGAV